MVPRRRPNRVVSNLECASRRGCANVSQCFPSSALPAADSLLLTPLHSLKRIAGDDEARSSRAAKTTSFGGASVPGPSLRSPCLPGTTMRTYCCANDKSYNFIIDQPCNGAFPKPYTKSEMLVTFQAPRLSGRCSRQSCHSSSRACVSDGAL